MTMDSFFDPYLPDTLKSRLDTAIRDAVSAYKEDNEGNPCFSRNRVFTMEQVIKLLLSMHGGSLNKELYTAGIKASPSAFSRQRDKIPLTVFGDVLEYFNLQCRDRQTYKGYRVFAVDGTTVNMARNPMSDSFMHGRSKGKNRDEIKGYNQLHVTPLYDVMNKPYRYAVIQPQPRQDEIGALTHLLNMCGDCFEEKTLIVADRGFESYNTFAYFQEEEHGNIDFLIRVKNDISGMREIRKLPMQELDTDIEFTLTTTQTKADKANGYIYINTHKNENKAYKSRARRWIYGSPYHMRFRVVRILLDSGEYETLATSLPRSITADEIKELYHSRWGIETAFRELKCAIGLVNLHGKKDEFVGQEIFAAMIMNNFTSRIVNGIVLEQEKDNALTYKVNQKMAIYLFREYFRKDHADGGQLMKDISRYTEAVRPERSDPRHIKAQFFRGFVYRVSA